MATIRGKYYFHWGLGSFGMTGTAVGTFLPQSVDYSKTAKQVEIMDGAGETSGIVFHDFNNTLTAEVTVQSTTVAGITAAATLPAIGEIITVTDTADTEVAGATTTAYVLIDVRKQRTNSDVCKATFELRRNTANNIAQTVS